MFDLTLSSGEGFCYHAPIGAHHYRMTELSERLKRIKIVPGVPSPIWGRNIWRGLRFCMSLCLDWSNWMRMLKTYFMRATVWYHPTQTLPSLGRAPLSQEIVLRLDPLTADFENQNQEQITSSHRILGSRDLARVRKMSCHL
jgi:hypothetical protein